MIRRILVLLGVFVASGPGALGAQSAQEIMEDAWEAYTERMADVQDYTVTHSVMGMSSTIHFVRSEVDGRVVFLPDMSQMQPAGPAEGTGQPAPAQFDGQYFMRPEIAERMTVEGRESVDGNECWIVALNDFEGIELGGLSGAQSDFEPESMRMFMDADEYIPRRIDMAGSIAGPDGPRPMSTSALMTDYRDIEGLLYPFRVEISSEGLGGAMGARMGGQTPEQQAQMQEAMARMRAELEKLPPEQRAMAERMMEAQMGGGMEAMLEEAMSDMVVETTEVKVNVGPPGDA